MRKEDYYNAWDGDDDNYEDWNWGGDGSYLGGGNLMLMLEKGGRLGETDPRRAQKQTDDPLREPR